MLKRKKWLAFLLVVCMLLTAMPVSAFADTGSGDERTLVCGLEESAGHTHDESCVCPGGELICGLEEGGHTHGDACYTEEQRLTCTSEEEGHEHTAACYTTEKVLTCGLEETEHVHSDACYCPGGEYICGLEEGEGHTHTDACYEEDSSEDVNDSEKGIMEVDLLSVPEGEAACTYESTGRTVISSEAVTMKEAVEALNNAGGGTIKVVSSGLADWNMIVESNITIIPADESNQVVIGLKEPDGYVGGQSSKDGMFQVKNDCVLTFGKEGLPEECLVFSGEKIEHSCIVTADEGYSTARVILNDGVLLTKCMDSAIGKHHDGSQGFSRSPHVEIHGAKVANNGTEDKPAYDSAIKSRSFTMTSGVICENYSRGGAGAIEINDGLKFVDDLDCRISGDSLIENCRSDTCGAILAEDLYISGNVTIRNCYGEDLAGAIYCGGDRAEISGLTIEYCKGGSAGAINSSSEELIIKDDVRISNCELIADFDNKYAIKMAGAIYCQHNLTIEGGEKGVIIENCKGIETAGAIYAKGTTTSIGGNVTLKNNTANYGGAIWTNSGQMDIKDGVQIINNTAQIAGGGIYVDGIDKNYITYMPHVTIYGGTIQENEAPKGGGIYLSSSNDSTELISAVVLKGGNIINNTAKDAGGGIYQSYGSYIYVSGSPNVTNNKTNDVTDNICLGWNGVHEVDGEQEIASFDDVYQSFKDGQDSFVAVFGKMYMNYYLNYYRTLIEAEYSELDEEDKVNAAKQFGLNDYVIIDDDTGEEKYIGTKEQFIDAYLKYMENALEEDIIEDIIEIYERLQKLPEEEQKKSLEKIYNQLKDIASIANSINAYITVVGALDDNAKIGITSEYPKYKRLVVEGGVDAKENADGEAYVLTDKDLKAFSSDNTYYSVEYNPQNKNQFVLMNFIKISPADVIIYMGGSSYGGVVDANGNLVGNNGFPEPGFTVILPEELNSVDMSKLHLQYKENDNSLLKWKFEKYGDGEHNIYRIVVDGETPQRDVRMEFENAQGQIVEKDTFDIKEHLNQTLIMRVYGDGIDAGKVSFMYEGKTYGISVLPATLTVRGTTNAVQYADPSDGIIAEKPGLITQEGTSYYVNGSEVEVMDTTGISLLFDEIINSNEANDNRTNLLLQRVEKILGNSDSDRVYDFKYLDLVDQNNGNAWVKADKPVTIYWPLPEGTNADTSFTLLHFTEAHRSLTEEQIKDAINNGDVETMKIKEVTNTHVVFDVTPGNFSPFVLIGEEKKSSDSGASSGGGHTSNTYYVRYHDNVETVKDGKFIPGETVTVKGNIFTAPRGKVLAGWSLEEDGKVEYKAGDTFRMPGKTLDLYAVWKDAEVEGHKAYITGYPDGTVGPDRSITRAEAATMFYNLLTDKSADKRLFADVPMDQWYAKPVTTLAGLGIISGYPDGTFKPNSPITRAEFVTMAMNFANAEKGTACSFPDVSENIWYYGAVAGATEHGWISGYPDGTFGPERNITRGEVASIINRMENRAADISFILENLDELHTFSDLPFQHWAYGSMMEAANGHNYVRESANAYEVWVSAQ